MNGFRVDPGAHVPPSVQIVEAMLDALAAGTFTAGERLPSVRALAVDVLVNPNTVAKAYAELERLGVVAGRNGSGVYVTEVGPARAADLRRASTLAELAEAVHRARRAGHAADAIAAVVEQVLGSEGAWR